MLIPIWAKWLGFVISNLMLGPSVMMLWKGSFPPPFTNRKAPLFLSTGLFVVGMTGLIVFGEYDLLKVTLALFGIS